MLRKIGSIISIFVFAVICMPQFAQAAEIDTDLDGVSDRLEKLYCLNELSPDTDDDGYFDIMELQNDYSPHVVGEVKLHEVDTDNDGLNDWLERWFGTSWCDSDSDNDGIDDFKEVATGTDPRSISQEKQFSQRIVVDRTKQRVYYYVDGVKLYNFPASTGNPDTETPSGVFEIQRKVEIKDYVGEDYHIKDVVWNLQFIPLYYIHTAFWHNDFGKRTHSHGCVNLREEDAKKLFDVVDLGVPVEIIGETPKNYVVEA